jgi:hypothetical protein
MTDEEIKDLMADLVETAIHINNNGQYRALVSFGLVIQITVDSVSNPYYVFGAHIFRHSTEDEINTIFNELEWHVEGEEDE